MCEVILPTTSDIFTFVTETLGGLAGVQGWTAGVELLTLKRGFIETPWSRAALASRNASPVPAARDAAPARG
jgi:hypothetical protein